MTDDNRKSWCRRRAYGWVTPERRWINDFATEQKRLYVTSIIHIHLGWPMIDSKSVRKRTNGPVSCNWGTVTVCQNGLDTKDEQFTRGYRTCRWISLSLTFSIKLWNGLCEGSRLLLLARFTSQPWRMRQYVAPKRRWTSIGLHGVTSWKTT
jgi:hypothetical protein